MWTWLKMYTFLVSHTGTILLCSKYWFIADLLKWPTFSWLVILLLAFLLGFIAVAKINRWSRKTFRPHSEDESDDLETNRRFSKNLHF